MISGRWLRIAPLESSTPLQTMSYWYALIVSGSAPSSASSPPCGIENGLWLNSIRFVSSFSSYIGKSVTQQKWKARSEEHTSELQSPCNLVCRLLLEKKKRTNTQYKSC